MSEVTNKETNKSNDSSNMKNNEGNNNNNNNNYYNKTNNTSEKQNSDNQKTNTNANGINNNNKNIDVDYSPFLLSPPEHQQNQMNMDNTLRNNSNFNANQQKQQSQQNTFDSASTEQTKTPLSNPNNNINDNSNNNNINSNKSTNSSKNSPAVEKFVNKHSRSNSNRETTSNGVKRSRKQSSESNASLHERPEKKECDHCRRRQTQCVQVPNLKNCVQCESKGIKCTYSEIASNKSTFELEQIKKRVDENVNVHDLLKRTKYDTSTKASSMPSQVANTSQNANQQSQLMNNIMGQNFNSLQGILDPSSISNANNNGQRNPLSNSNGILSPDILNAMSPLNFNPNNNNTSNNSNINLTNALASAFNSINSKGNLNNNNNNNNNTINNNLLSGIVSNLLMNNMNPGNNPNQQQTSPSQNFNNNDLNFSYIPKNNSNNNLNQNFNNDVNGINNMGQLPQNLNAMSLASIYSQLTGNSFPQQPPSSFFNNNNNNMNVNNNNSNNIINSSNNNSNSTINIAASNIKPPNPNGAPSYPRSSFYLGPTSLIDYNLINHVKVDKIDQIQISPSLALRKVAPNVQFLLRDDFNEKLYLKQEQELDLVEKLIHPHGKTLVDIFFKVVHPHYPILHEKVFMEKYSRSYRELTTPLLASIYCLSLEWWEFHPQLIGFPKPDVKKQLMDIAIRSFFEVVERPKLSIVQAGLLILKCRSETSNNWVIASEVVALAEELGLGIDCQEWRLPKWERGLRRRLAWAVWSMEKWTSANEGRFSHLILGRNWMVKMLSDEDFPNDIGTHSLTNKKNGANNNNNNNSFNGGTPNTNISNNTPNNALNGAGLNSNGQPMLFTSILDSNLSSEEIKDKKQLFQQYVSLSIILGEILDTFYTLGAMSVTNNIEYVLKLAKPLQLKLREWYHSLPPKLSMNHLEQGKFNSNAALTLAYFGTEICLHRKILTILDCDKSPGNTPELKRVCRDAANTRVLAAIDFVSDLKPEHINGFWYSCSSNNLSLIGSFIALLYCTSDSLEEKNTYRGYLKKYINILKTSLVNFQKAQLALEFSQLLDDILI